MLNKFNLIDLQHFQNQIGSYLLFIEGLIYMLSESALKRLNEKKNPAQIEKTEERYRSILKAITDGYWLTDIQGHLLEVNAAYCRMSGYREDELLSMRISDLVVVETPSLVTDRMEKIIPRGSDRFESRHRRKDGSLFDVDASIQFHLDEGGKCACFFQDITERRQAERQYRMLFQEMLDGFALHEIICDNEGHPADYRFLAVNPAFEKITGLAAERVVNRTVLEVLPGIERYWIETYGRVALSGEPAFFENYASEIGKHFQVTAFRPAPGQFACIFSDITERKMAELALKASEEKFRSFAEQSFVGLYLVQDGFLKYVNPKFADIFGYTAEECLDGMHFRRLVHPDDLVMAQEQIRRRIAGEQKAVQYTLRGIRKSGEIIHLAIYGASLTFREKPAAIGTILDITRELEMKKRVAQSQRMEAIGSLAGGIAHDFNNILFPIIGLSELLMEDLAPDSPEYDNAAEIYSAGKRGSDLIKQILAFSRQSEHRKIPIRIQQILKEVMKLSRATIPANIQLTRDIQDDCPLVLADPTQIHQIAMNLITNAYHAVEQTNGAISVQLRQTTIGTDALPDEALAPGRYALLTVSDTGNGIHPAIIGKIFEPYFTTKALGKGTCLGLAVVYGIVKELNGDIAVTSKLGKGSAFKVYLPILEKASASLSAEARADDPMGDESILLVDDEAPIVRLEKQVLERLGYRVTAHMNSTEALAVFKADPDGFDLIVTDLTMPRMTGDQLAREVIALRPDIPILICTGFSERINPEKAAAIGVKGLLMKPIIKSELANMVRTVLDRVHGRIHR